MGQTYEEIFGEPPKKYSEGGAKMSKKLFDTILLDRLNMRQVIFILCKSNWEIYDYKDFCINFVKLTKEASEEEFKKFYDDNIIQINNLGLSLPNKLVFNLDTQESIRLF